MHQLSEFLVVVGALNSPTVIALNKTVMQNYIAYSKTYLYTVSVISKCCTAIDVGPRMSFGAFESASCCIVLV